MKPTIATRTRPSQHRLRFKPACKRKRTGKQRRPLVNPLHIAEGLSPISSHDGHNLKWALQSRMAFEALRTGTGTLTDVCTIIATARMVSVIAKAGLGTEYQDIAEAVMKAADEVATRHAKTGRAGLNHEQREAIAQLMDLHEAQHENLTVVDAERALAAAIRDLRNDQRFMRDLHKVSK